MTSPRPGQPKQPPVRRLLRARALLSLTVCRFGFSDFGFLSSFAPRPSDPVQLAPVPLAHGGRREHPLQEPVLTQPRMPNAGSFTLLERTDEGKLAPGMIQVPGDEPELFCFRVEIQQKVLAITERAV